MQEAQLCLGCLEQVLLHRARDASLGTIASLPVVGSQPDDDTTLCAEPALGSTYLKGGECKNPYTATIDTRVYRKSVVVRYRLLTKDCGLKIHPNGQGRWVEREKSRRGRMLARLAKEERLKRLAAAWARVVYRN